MLAVDMNVAAVEETRAIIQKEGNECTIQRADVTKSEQVKAAVETCIQTYGRVDILVNNVGIVEVGGPWELKRKIGTMSSTST